LVAAGYRISLGNAPATKSVLIAIADAGCNACGLAWPGAPLLESKTELGNSTVRKSLNELERQGLIRTVRYPNGGRGVTTEYLVLEHVVELSPAPCEECRKRMKNPPPAGTYNKSVTNKPATTERVSGETRHHRAKNPPPRGDQQSVTATTVSTPTVESSPTAHLKSPSDPTDPTPWAENAAQARALADKFGATSDPPSSRDAT
jgi:hypothetical protein